MQLIQNDTRVRKYFGDTNYAVWQTMQDRKYFGDTNYAVRQTMQDIHTFNLEVLDAHLYLRT